MASDQKEEHDKNIVNRLFQVSNNIIDSWIERMPQFMKMTWDELSKQFPKPGTETWKVWADNLVKQGRCDQDTADAIKDLIEYPFPLNIVYFVMSVISVTMTDVQNTLQIYGLDQQYQQMAKTTPHPAPPDSLIKSMIMDPGRSKENRAELKKHGFNDTQIDNMILGYYATVDLNTVRYLYLKGHYDTDKLYERMRELGFTDTRTAEYLESWKVIPGPQDLLTMYAKEAFEPDIYKKIGLDAEYPTEGEKFLQAHGISPEWVKRYWYAHWNEPSIQQGYEMLHRDVIDLETLDLLYRAVEIPPFWRDKLTAIAYTPFTRVDVRRMHDLGVIKDDGLIRAYKDIGYNDEKAAKLAEFTIAYNTDSDRQLTKSAVLESYSEGLITRATARNLLIDQGYSEDAVDYYIEIENYNHAKEINKLQIENVRERFLLGFINEDKARSEFNTLGLLGSKTDAIITDLKLQQYKYESTPSRTDLESFLLKGIISEDDYIAGMKRLGYSESIANLYVSEMAYERYETTRHPSRTDLAKFYNDKIITLEEWRTEMTLIGYPDKYIAWYEKLL